MATLARFGQQMRCLYQINYFLTRTEQVLFMAPSQLSSMLITEGARRMSDCKFNRNEERAANPRSSWPRMRQCAPRSSTIVVAMT
jgi:hypothetical protein